MKKGIVVDKSYLHRYHRMEADVLGSNYFFLVTETLLYELSKDEDDRVRLFDNIRKIPYEYRYVESINILFSYENASLAPVPDLMGLPDNRDYSSMLKINEAYLRGMQLEGAIEERKSFIRQYRDAVIFISRELRKDFPGAFFGRDDCKAQRLERLNVRIANNGKFVRRYLSKLMGAVAGTRSALIARQAKKNWAHYRWAQVILLMALDVGSRLPSDGSMPDKFLEKIEHDVLDMHYLVPALLVGALATRDAKMKRWWRRLSPKGVLFEGGTAKPALAQAL